MQRVVYGVMTFQHHPDAIFENFSLLQQVFIPVFSFLEKIFIPNFSFISRLSFFLLICVCICSSYVHRGRVVFHYFHIFFFLILGTCGWGHPPTYHGEHFILHCIHSFFIFVSLSGAFLRSNVQYHAFMKSLVRLCFFRFFFLLFKV